MFVQKVHKTLLELHKETEIKLMYKHLSKHYEHLKELPNKHEPDKKSI